MAEPRTVVCDSCGQSFPINLTEEPQAGGGVYQFMQCPHCERVYPVARISQRGVGLLRRIEVIRAKAATASSQARLESLLRQYQREVVGPSDAKWSAA